MSLNYAARLPIDASGLPMQEFPSPKVANVVWKVHTALASSVITLNEKTTVLEVGAGGGAVLMRWVPATENASIAGYKASIVSSGLGVANFDHSIPAGTIRRFVVPIETLPTASVLATHAGPLLANGLYQRVAWIASSAETNASILATEF